VADVVLAPAGAIPLPVRVVGPVQALRPFACSMVTAPALFTMKTSRKFRRAAISRGGAKENIPSTDPGARISFWPAYRL
jgi:hypothetical protein